MYRVVHDFFDKIDGKQYKEGDEYTGKEADALLAGTKFRPALIVEEKAKAKAPAKEKETGEVVADEKPKPTKKN